ncbi:hypothetical protein HPB47_024987 [Ixodes persulcatus]|uniref:Uncharacterized protein n=1 Tax=Ixodes persulcatus TaxID=34615 RepID=A0AC60Q4U6_IXOPE|nr:hypothetical protein HPB47_024987 [Ixodes persulcatus]
MDGQNLLVVHTGLNDVLQGRDQNLVKNDVEAPPTPFHFSGANGGEEVAFSPALALPKRKESYQSTTEQATHRTVGLKDLNDRRTDNSLGGRRTHQLVSMAGNEVGTSRKSDQTIGERHEMETGTHREQVRLSAEARPSNVPLAAQLKDKRHRSGIQAEAPPSCLSIAA